ncbi:hypothetical protein V1527DRAFT_456363 [Lipomyces starkeyi]
MFLVEGIAQLHPALVTAPAIWSLGNKVFFLAVLFWVILYCLKSLEEGRQRSPTPCMASWCRLYHSLFQTFTLFHPLSVVCLSWFLGRLFSAGLWQSLIVVKDCFSIQ